MEFQTNITLPNAFVLTRQHNIMRTAEVGFPEDFSTMKPSVLYLLSKGLCKEKQIQKIRDYYGSGWVVPGAKTINVFRACLGAQLTICAQK